MKVMTTSADAPIFSASAHRVRYLRIISILGFITATILVPMHILWGIDVLAIVCGTFAATCIFVIMMLQKRGLLVGRARFELATNGLKVRCSTD